MKDLMRGDNWLGKLVITFGNTVVDPHTMMIKIINTTPTLPAMLSIDTS